MVISQNYEMIEIAEEYLAVPIGEMAKENRDVYSFSKSAAFLLEQLKKPKSKQDLIECLLEEYDLDRQTAVTDIDRFVGLLLKFGLIIQ